VVGGVWMRDAAVEIVGVGGAADLAHPRAELFGFNVYEISLRRRRDGCDLELVILSRFWPADQRMRQEGLMQCSRRSSSLLIGLMRGAGMHHHRFDSDYRVAALLVDSCLAAALRPKGRINARHRTEFPSSRTARSAEPR